MNKKELVEQLAEGVNITKTEATGIVSSIFEIMTTALDEDGEVKIMGFGNFRVAERKERVGRNPKTGKEVVIPAANVVKFKASANLNKEVN